MGATSSQLIIEMVRSQFKDMDFIPLHAPTFGGNEKKYLSECIDTTYVSSVGAFVDHFEHDLSKRIGVPKSVAVVNGTAALHCALKLLGVDEKQEVLSQALTFVATCNAISYCGAKSVFIDVDRDTMGLSPKALTDFLNEFGDRREDGTYNKKTQKKLGACVVMHTFGFAARIEELTAICRDWKIPLIEDAAEAIGSSSHGKPLGSFGEIGTFSFNGNKIITSGGGGALVSPDETLMIKAKHLTTTAKVPHSYEFIHDEIGYNYRMPNINAALLCAQMEQLDYFLERKRELASFYRKNCDANGLVFRWERENTRANFWLMCIETQDRTERDEILKITNDQKVMTRPIWQLMYKLPTFSDCQRDDQQNAEYLEDRIINIPSSVI
ncbi:putative pyridoxal phosphate-dependent aminotransferase EpsN [compost metagenome]